MCVCLPEGEGGCIFVLHWMELTVDLSYLILVIIHHSRNVTVKHKNICVPSNDWFLLVSITEHYNKCFCLRALERFNNQFKPPLQRYLLVICLLHLLSILNILSGSVTLCLIYTEGLSNIAGKVTALRFPIIFKVLIGGNSLVELFYC